MLPLDVLEVIVTHMDTKTRARFECVSKTALRACDNAPLPCIEAALPPGKQAALSFAHLLFRKRHSIRNITLSCDINVWSWVWRYMPCGMRELKHMCLLHTNATPVDLASPEDVLPSAPMLDIFAVVSNTDVALGRGFSRLRARTLSITALSVACEEGCWVTPSLHYLQLRTYKVLDASGLQGLMYARLKFLEGPVAILGVVPLLRLDAISVHGPAIVPPSDYVLPESIRTVHLRYGTWRTVDWMPHVKILEFFCCVGVPDTRALTSLRTLCVSTTPVTLDSYLHVHNLTHFYFESAGCAFDRFIVFSGAATIAPADADKITVYAPRQ